MTRHSALVRFGSFLCFTLLLGAPAAQAEGPGKARAPSGEQRRAPTERLRAPALDAARASMLVLQSAGDDEGWLAPQVSNTANIRVTGLVARTHVEQAFENPSSDVVEAVYVFPLPETAAVDGMTLQIGARKIIGEVRERAAALQAFENAKAGGKKASLLEQERPNLFTTRVANIGPGESVTITLSYQEDVRYDSGRFSLAFPSTLTPRYIRASAAAADAARVTPPMLLDDGPSLDVSVTLDAGFPLAHVQSPSHAIDVTPPPSPSGPVSVTLGNSTLADRDFRLEWEPKPDRAPRSALFQEEFNGHRYAMLMLLPPARGAGSEPRMARESIFVIDTSGSMDGTSIEQARAALVMGLGRLSARDHFNVIEFNSTARSLFLEPAPATPENVERARTWVRSLSADGGTEMLSALELALTGSSPTDRVRQVVFVTDGSVGNETELSGFIHDHLGAQRLFTVGIGSAPNHYFMRSAARFGRGTFTHIADVSEVTSKMSELWGKLDAPVANDLRLAWKGGAHTESWPERVPDLYQGEPLVVLAKLDPGAHAVELAGRLGDHPFATELPLPSAAGAGAHKAPERGLHRLWARRKIEGLMDRLIEGRSEEEIRPLVTAIALEHRLLSKYTSFVAIDSARSVDAPGRSVDVANAMPAGNAMFGNLPQTATPGPTCLLTSLLSFAGALWLRKPRALRLWPRRSPHASAASETNDGRGDT